MGLYIEMRMRWVHLSIRTEGIKAFSKRMRRCSVEGRKRYENGKCGRKSFWKRISVDGALYLECNMIYSCIFFFALLNNQKC